MWFMDLDTCCQSILFPRSHHQSRREAGSVFTVDTFTGIVSAWYLEDSHWHSVNARFSPEVCICKGNMELSNDGRSLYVIAFVYKSWGLVAGKLVLMILSLEATSRGMVR